MLSDSNEFRFSNAIAGRDLILQRKWCGFKVWKDVYRVLNSPVIKLLAQKLYSLIFLQVQEGDGITVAHKSVFSDRTNIIRSQIQVT